MAAEIFVIAVMAAIIVAQLVSSYLEKVRLAQKIYRFNILRTNGYTKNVEEMLIGLVTALYGDNLPRYADGTAVRLGDTVVCRDAATGEEMFGQILLSMVLTKEKAVVVDADEPMYLSMENKCIPLTEAMQRFPFMKRTGIPGASPFAPFHDRRTERVLPFLEALSALRLAADGVIHHKEVYIATACVAFRVTRSFLWLGRRLESAYFDGRQITMEDLERIENES